jgi:hypothetical protein
MLALYRSLLRLYPAPYRQQFAEEMIAVFRDIDADAHNKGSVTTAKLYLREISGLFRGAIAEHARRILGNHIPFPISSRRFTMRSSSSFRFPTSTSFLMTVILAGIVLAIQKAEAIRDVLPADIAPAGPMWAPHVGILATIALTFLGVYMAGAVGWVVLFALRRSGMHRLSQMSSTPER